jgi:hypothetical protein
MDFLGLDTMPIAIDSSVQEEWETLDEKGQKKVKN